MYFWLVLCLFGFSEFTLLQNFKNSSVRKFTGSQTVNMYVTNGKKKIAKAVVFSTTTTTITWFFFFTVNLIQFTVIILTYIVLEIYDLLRFYLTNKCVCVAFHVEQYSYKIIYTMNFIYYYSA